jgi:hypothetical protein
MRSGARRADRKHRCVAQLAMFNEERWFKTFKQFKPFKSLRTRFQTFQMFQMFQTFQSFQSLKTLFGGTDLGEASFP